LLSNSLFTQSRKMSFICSNIIVESVLTRIFLLSLLKTVSKGLKWPQLNQVYLWWSCKDKCLTQSKILILQMWQTIVEWLFSLFPFSLYYWYILSVEYKYELCFALPPTLAAQGIAMSIVWKLIIFRLHTSLHTKQLYPSIIIDISNIMKRGKEKKVIQQLSVTFVGSVFYSVLNICLYTTIINTLDLIVVISNL
jgi:hypothetical protein